MRTWPSAPHASLASTSEDVTSLQRHCLVGRHKDTPRRLSRSTYDADFRAIQRARKDTTASMPPVPSYGYGHAHSRQPARFLEEAQAKARAPRYHYAHRLVAARDDTRHLAFHLCRLPHSTSLPLAHTSLLILATILRYHAYGSTGRCFSHFADYHTPCVGAGRPSRPYFISAAISTMKISLCSVRAARKAEAFSPIGYYWLMGRYREYWSESSRHARHASAPAH